MAAALTLGLAACAPGAQTATPGAAQGRQTVGLDGQSFAVLVAPGPQGRAFTRAGAVAVSGQRIAVTRAGTALGPAEGAMSKRVAKLGCEQSGGRFNGAALGRYAGQGVWSFDGGCA